VQRHGGELQIQSEPGKGSRFKLLFPAIRVRISGQPAVTHGDIFLAAAASG
jgi:two-component system phosphate regulon sensor histidine kinase PhoR